MTSEDPGREIIRTPNDKRAGAGAAMPRHAKVRAAALPAWNGGRAAREPRRPVIWAHVETIHGPEPIFGAYPARFIPWALRQLGVAAREVLHVCSGSLTRADVGGGPRVDLRSAACPDLLADGRALPFPDDSFAAAMIDPPYSVEYADELYGTDYPRPSHLLREAARVVRPCGRIGFLHFLVPSPPPGARILRVVGVTQGCGYRIRAWTLYELEQDGLFE